MITPTVGRVIWLWNNETQDQPFNAHVCHVNADGTVNLAYNDSAGSPGKVSNVQLWQGDGEKPALPYAEWMPYQKGQAVKVDAADAALKAAEVALHAVDSSTASPV